MARSFLLSSLLGALALAGPALASSGAFDFELSTVPEARCEKIEGLKTACPIARALAAWFSRPEATCPHGAATAGMDVERAAVRWAHGKWAPQSYKVRVTRVEISNSGPVCEHPPREVTLAVYDREDHLVTRTRVFVVAAKDGWSVTAH
jgi:hypothetical protein